ncbi:MAG: cytidine deaminase [Clostridiales bacterium]|nr:cytidine deaminase [Clostridiales bacterium]
MTDRDLLNHAAAAMKNSYAPYSRFKVGAAVECEDGSVFSGCKIENAAMEATLCAERAAIAAAVLAGRRRFLRLAICAEGPRYCVPCGTCRQFLQEFAPEAEILCSRADGRYVSYKLPELLPHPFTAEHLG